MSGWTLIVEVSQMDSCNVSKEIQNNREIHYNHRKREHLRLLNNYDSESPKCASFDVNFLNEWAEKALHLKIKRLMLNVTSVCIAVCSKLQAQCQHYHILRLECKK